MTAQDDRDEEDWPEDDLNHPPSEGTRELPDPADREDDAAPLPARHRRPAHRRRTSYRPPSELDHD